MTEFKRTQEMHQYYRDILVKTYFFDEFGKIPKDKLIALIDSSACDPIFCAEALHNFQSGLPAAKDLALKQMVMLIAQSHLSMDKHRNGIKARCPQPTKKGFATG
ncbi:hypothetical protein [Limnobacter sp.]|uniref:hypothetical protein n=1 Tax=Limnobacter sp. TaxID=2003368 RepID=UPI003BACBB26